MRITIVETLEVPDKYLKNVARDYLNDIDNYDENNECLCLDDETISEYVHDMIGEEDFDFCRQFHISDDSNTALVERVKMFINEQQIKFNHIHKKN